MARPLQAYCGGDVAERGTLDHLTEGWAKSSPPEII